MKSIRYIALLLFAAATLWRCGEDQQVDIAAQRKAFEDFLTGVTEKTGFAVDQELVRDHNIYRLTPGQGRSNRHIEAGDLVTIEYYGFEFSASTEFGMGGLFTTNNRQAAVEAELTDYPDKVLPPEDLTVRQGAGEILRGIDQGLIRAGLRDTVLLYLTCELTYGQGKAGALKPGTPTVFRVIIKDINE